MTSLLYANFSNTQPLCFILAQFHDKIHIYFRPSLTYFSWYLLLPARFPLRILQKMFYLFCIFNLYLLHKSVIVVSLYIYYTKVWLLSHYIFTTQKCDGCLTIYLLHKSVIVVSLYIYYIKVWLLSHYIFTT
jgi:hypothetical protein